MVACCLRFPLPSAVFFSSLCPPRATPAGVISSCWTRRLRAGRHSSRGARSPRPPTSDHRPTCRTLSCGLPADPRHWPADPRCRPAQRQWSRLRQMPRQKAACRGQRSEACPPISGARCSCHHSSARNAVCCSEGEGEGAAALECVRWSVQECAVQDQPGTLAVGGAVWRHLYRRADGLLAVGGRAGVDAGGGGHFLVSRKQRGINK